MSTQRRLDSFVNSDDEVVNAFSGTLGGPINMDVNAILSQKHIGGKMTPMTPPYENYDGDQEMNEFDDEAEANGIIPFGSDKSPSFGDDNCTPSRTSTKTAVKPTVATSPVVDDGLDNTGKGAFPFGNDDNGPAAPKAADLQSDDDDEALALFLSANITGSDGKTLDTVQLDRGGVAALLKQSGFVGDTIPTTITIQKHESMRPKPTRNFSTFLAQNKASQQQSASFQIRNAVNRAQSGRYNKRQKVTATDEQPPPKVNNPFDNKRENDRRSLCGNLRKYRKVKGRYSLGMRPHNLLIDSYTTRHSVTDERYSRFISRMFQYPPVIRRVDYRPVTVPNAVQFSGPGVGSMGYLQHETWNKLHSIDRDDRHILAFVTPESGDVRGGYNCITFNPFTANGGIIGLLEGYDLGVNDTLSGVMSYKTLPISITLKEPSYSWMDVHIQMQSKPGGRFPLRDINDNVLRRQIMNGYNRKLLNTLYGAASIMRDFHGDFFTDIDLNGVCAVLRIPPLSDDAFLLDMSTSVITDKLLGDTAVWSYSLEHKLKNNHFSHPVSVFPFDLGNKIENIGKAMMITMDSVILDRFFDVNKGDCDKHVRCATIKNANKLVLVGVDPADTEGFLHEIRLMLHSNKINTSAGIVNIVEASPSNANFVIKSTLNFCAIHRELDPDCGGIKCTTFEEKKRIHDRIVTDTYKHKPIDQQESLRKMHCLKHCNRCGDTYTTKHEVCPIWARRPRDLRDGSQALLFTSGSPAHTAKICFTQNVIIRKMLGQNPYDLSDRDLMDWRLRPETKRILGNLSCDDLFFHNLVEATEEKSDAADGNNAHGVVVRFDKIDALLALKYSFTSQPLRMNEVRYTISAAVPSEQAENGNSNNSRNNNNNGSSRVLADF